MTISTELIKRLRDQTGAGMLSCKNALVDSEGNFEKAVQLLRQKGLTSAEKKNSRTTKQGIISSYIHAGSKIGVLLEINCETDFVARRIEFQNLAKQLAMQIAAGTGISYISIHDIPPEIWENERIIEKQREDIQNKPQSIRDSIIEGRVEKTLRSMTLLDQPYLRTPEISVSDFIKSHISLLGENIQVTRYCKFIVGENDKH